uniref:Uncharacterized protein n=1 Tax=Romanomermis culicivorax TaxID=13658 RepID=A0A915KTQ3_ROMCU
MDSTGGIISRFNQVKRTMLRESQSAATGGYLEELTMNMNPLDNAFYDERSIKKVKKQTSSAVNHSIDNKSQIKEMMPQKTPRGRENDDLEKLIMAIDSMLLNVEDTIIDGQCSLTLLSKDVEKVMLQKIPTTAMNSNEIC